MSKLPKQMKPACMECGSGQVYFRKHSNDYFCRLCASLTPFSERFKKAKKVVMS